MIIQYFTNTKYSKYYKTCLNNNPNFFFLFKTIKNLNIYIYNHTYLIIYIYNNKY